MSKLVRTVFLAASVLILTVTTALASEASDAYKEADSKVKAAERADSDEAQAAQMAEIQDWARARAKALLSGEPSRMDIGYVGRMQNRAGLHDEAVVTLARALADTRKTKHEHYLHFFYIQALIGTDQLDKAFTQFETLQKDFEGSKGAKYAAKDVGKAMRRARRWKESAVAFDAALKAKDASALKPLVNSLLLDGQRDAAIAAIEYAIEKAGTRGADADHPILLHLAKTWGTKVTPEIDAYAPGPAPDLSGKVVVMGFWNMGAGSMRWTMGLLNHIFDTYPPVDGVEVLAVTRYYQKNPDTGKIEDDMTPEAEREHALAFRQATNFQGQLAFMPTVEAMQALGMSKLPHVVVIGKDGTLLYAHTVDRREPTEIDVILEIVKKAAGK